MKFFDQHTDKKIVILRKLKNIAMPMTMFFRETTHVVPKGTPLGSKKTFTENEGKHELSMKWDPLDFEYAKMIEEQQLSQRSNVRVLDKLSRVLKAMKKKKIIEK